MTEETTTQETTQEPETMPEMERLYELLDESIDKIKSDSIGQPLLVMICGEDGICLSPNWFDRVHATKMVLRVAVTLSKDVVEELALFSPVLEQMHRLDTKQQKEHEKQEKKDEPRGYS